MRIACVYLPSFPLQAHVRQAPHLAGTSLVVVESAATGSVVRGCSRAAWADGIRPGMVAATARVIVPELVVMPADRALYERALDAVIESLLVCSDVIDVSRAGDAMAPHRAIFVEVPARARAASFGQRLLVELGRQGFRARVGIADDRFTAHVAAVRVDQRGSSARLDDPRLPAFYSSCTVVPRGGSAAFLAPLPLSYLPMDADVQHLLETLGVKTLGDFAALPPPSVSRGWIDEDHDFQALARGQGPAALRGLAREEALGRPLIERMDVTGSAQALALRALCEHVSGRLRGRDRAATCAILRLLGHEEQVEEIVISLAGGELLGQVQSAAARLEPGHAVVALELEIVAEGAPLAAATPGALELFAAAEPPGMATGAAQDEVAVLRQAEAPRPDVIEWSAPRPRRPRRSRLAPVQQLLSFCE